MSAVSTSAAKTEFSPGKIRRAFTLIELLVVIAILAALLLPALSAAKQKAQVAWAKFIFVRPNKIETSLAKARLVFLHG